MLDADAGRRRSRPPPSAVADGRARRPVPVDVFQTGSGTSSNMNVNEVIATPRRAGRRRASTPTTTSTPASRATTPSRPRSTSRRPLAVVEDLLPGARRARGAAWRPRPTSSPTLVKSGRTHLMDATPVTLGQEFGGYAATVRLRRRAARTASSPGSRELPLGRHRGRHRHQHPARLRRAASIAELAETTGLPFTEARNHFEAQGARDALVELSGVLRTIAVGLTKICNDLRWMASGPTHRPRRDPPARPPAGVEHHARQGQPGAARGDADGLRPGDRQRRRRRRGRRAAAASSSTSMMPVIARNLLESIRLLARVHAACSPTRCVDGITAERRADAAVRRVLALGRHPAQPRTSATRRGGGRQAGARRRRSPSARPSSRWGTSSAARSPSEQLDAALDVDEMTHP